MSYAVNMSDANLLITVENMINLAMGSTSENKINFKLVQTILHILARQLRVLEQKIELRPEVYDDVPEIQKTRRESTVGKRKKPRDKSSKKETEGKYSDGDEAAPAEGQPDGAKDASSAGKKSRRKSSIYIKEEQRDKEKVLVVDRNKSPVEASRAARGSIDHITSSASDVRIPRVGSIEVVSRKEYIRLKDMVDDLKSLTAPIPAPTLPDNQMLRDNIAKGQANLTDTMEAMQVTARVEAAEQGIERLVSLLTSIVSSNALPPEIQKKTAQLLQAQERRVSRPAAVSGAKSVIFSQPDDGPGGTRSAMGALSDVTTNTRDRTDCVTRDQMDSALESLQAELFKNITKVSRNSTSVVSDAITNIHTLSEKMEEAISMQERLERIISEMTIYYEQLNGFDDGFASQLANNEVQIQQMKADLKSEVEKMEAANSNTETAAVRELTERYEALVQELDAANFTNARLHGYQTTLENELKRLTESVELLSEMKSDRIELVDSIRDKADNSQLVGLLKETAFGLTKRNLEHSISICNRRFDDFDRVWQNVLNDLSRDIDEKATLIQMQFLKNEFDDDLEELKHKLDQLAAIIGEPTAAILTRKLSKDGSCGVCFVPALMSPSIDMKIDRPPIPGAEDTEWIPPPQEHRNHFCNRWCGGSHTIINPSVKRVHEVPKPHGIVSPIPEFGEDGRMYLFEKVLEPCKECNVSLDDVQN